MKYQLEQQLSLLEIPGAKCVIKGIRVCSEPPESIDSSWQYKTEYSIWYVGQDAEWRKRWNANNPEDPANETDFLEWKEWGWVSEQELIKKEQESTSHP